MKTSNFILVLFLSTICGFAQTYTNGVFLKDGKTTEIEKKVYQFNPTNKTEILQFSNDLIVKVNTNSDFLVNSFFQDVHDINTTPKKSKFGNANFAASLLNGSAMMIYSGATNDNSSCVISTPLMDVELYRGTFYFDVSETNVNVFVIDGSLNANCDRYKPIVVTSNNVAVAEVGIISLSKNKKTNFSPVKFTEVDPAVIDKLTKDSKSLFDIKKTTIFATINGKVVGILIN